MLEYIASTGTPSGSFLEIDGIPATYNSLLVTGVMSCTGTTVGDAYMRFQHSHDFDLQFHVWRP